MIQVRPRLTSYCCASPKSGIIIVGTIDERDRCTTEADRITNRVGQGTGVFALGAPRAIEFGIRLAF